MKKPRIGTSKKAPAELGKRPRLRDLGVSIGRFEPGAVNAITDVAGVRVGHVTLVDGEGPLRPGFGPIRTGVTAVFPAEGDLFHHRVFAGSHVLNGAGELMGLLQVNEWGICETPILLTSTLSVGRVADAAISWLWRRNPEIGGTMDVVIPVVAECDDAFLNDAVGRHVREEHVWAALDGAKAGAVAEGNVGAGTGMQTFDFAGGIGTSSRRVDVAGRRATIGALVLSNFGALELLRVDGVPMGKLLGGSFASLPRRPPAGSAVVLLATDLPLLPGQLSRVAARGALALGRVGGHAANNSGEMVLAWSTANRVPRERLARPLAIEMALDNELDPLYEATIDTVEEAVLNAICAGTAVRGQNGHAVPALPVEDVKAWMKRARSVMGS